ncbi:potassium channel subfamily K member 10-like isoform X2 [Prorops nasuta]|uniref:potassium channel subfamily K member 10-like isoform X2 n=1 Tax=Prorops nasuta TaxID=863751 RepID=UPI0034CFB3D5
MTKMTRTTTMSSVLLVDTPTTISEEISPSFRNGINSLAEKKPQSKTSGTQTIVGQLFRLRVLPSLKDIVDEENANSVDQKRCSGCWRHLRLLGRLALCQFGLAWLLSIWAMAGAAAFCATEGPREREQVVELKDMQRDLAVGLAMELRQLRTEQDQDVEPLWSNKVRQYVAKHEKLLLVAVSSGYGEGGNDGQLWTFPGSVLFAISILTTLGFGAPVPRTNAGRTVAVVFAAIGIPAHFLLIMNLGILLAVKLQKFAIVRSCRKKGISEPNYPLPIPRWVKAVPFVSIVIYYTIGILGFGIARSRPLSASVLFPLDFTAAGGLSTTRGYVRILYGLYLEGAVTLAAIVVAVLRVSATQSFTNIGLKYGLLIEA